jgi:hypothetical protein
MVDSDTRSEDEKEQPPTVLEAWPETSLKQEEQNIVLDEFKHEDIQEDAATSSKQTAPSEQTEDIKELPKEEAIEAATESEEVIDSSPKEATDLSNEEVGGRKENEVTDLSQERDIKQSETITETPQQVEKDDIKNVLHTEEIEVPSEGIVEEPNISEPKDDESEFT